MDDVVEIPLSQGKVAIVDLADYPLVSGKKWTAHNGNGRWYAFRNIPDHKGTELMHRVIMGAKKGEQIDHQDCDGLNNRRANLRFSNQSQNLANQRLRSNNTSGFKGVCWDKTTTKWKATFKSKRKQHHIGLFEKVEDAAKAYDLYALEEWGQFARLNFPQGSKNDDSSTPPHELQLSC